MALASASINKTSKVIQIARLSTRSSKETSIAKAHRRGLSISEHLDRMPGNLAKSRIDMQQTTTANPRRIFSQQLSHRRPGFHSMNQSAQFEERQRKQAFEPQNDEQAKNALNQHWNQSRQRAKAVLEMIDQRNFSSRSFTDE